MRVTGRTWAWLCVCALCVALCGCATERRRGYWDAKGFHELRTVRIPAGQGG